MRTREVRPELLDHLCPDDPAAMASRRDLRLINAVMGNHRWLARRLAACLRPGDHVVELGAGDPSLAMRLLPLLRARDARFTALDLVPPPEGWPDDPCLCWHRGDLKKAGPARTATVIVANLALHHFQQEDLALIAGHWHSARLVLASEPLRARAWMRFALYPFGLHPVTRHDMAASIRAGFRGRGLSEALGLAEPTWRLSERGTLVGAHRLEAWRAREAAQG